MEEILKKIGFVKAEIKFFSNNYMALDDTERSLLSKLGEEFSACQNKEQCNAVQKKLKPLSEKYGIDSLSMDMLFLA